MNTLRRVMIRLCGIILIFALVFNAPSQASTVSASTAAAGASDASIMFVENEGQFADVMRYQVLGGSSVISLAQDALWVTLMEEPSLNNTGQPGLPLEKKLQTEQPKGVIIKLSFAGSNPSPILEPFDPIEVSVNFFHGSDSANWKSNVPVWGGVRYKDLYPGIDLEVSSENGQVVQRLVVDAGADLDAVKLTVEGADSISIESDHLLISSSAGQLSLPLLQVSGVAYSTLPKARIEGILVGSPYALGGQSLEKTSSRVGVDDLDYSTFIGGAVSDYSGGMAIDADNNVYFTGETGMPFEGELFPTTPGVFDPNLYNAEAFVAKFNPTGQPVYISFLGGNGTERGIDITADASGNAYITGETNGTNGQAFPTTPGAYDVTPDPNDSNSYKDAFMSKVNPSGSTLLYSTFIGPDGIHDTGASIAVDSSGDVYIGGQTDSSSFPTTTGAFSTTFGGGDNDAFILKLSPDGAGSTDLVYSTFLGGDNQDMINSIVVNGDNEVYAGGYSQSANFPVTVGAYDETHGGEGDGIITKLNAAGSALVYSTFLGAEYYESVNSIDIDATGAAYVTGWTPSNGFPVTSGAFDTTLGPTNQAYVTKISPDGSALAYSTYLGGDTGWDSGFDITVGPDGTAYVTGMTMSSDFPTTYGAFDNTFNGYGNYMAGDTFVVKVNTTGSGLNYSTYLGGSDDELVYSGPHIALDSNEDVFVVGETRSTDFPITGDAYDTTLSGTSTFDLFLSRIDIHATTIAVPALISPIAGKFTNDTTPTFNWNAVTGGYKYRIQISKNNTFSPLVKNVLLGPGVLTYTSSALANAKYYWRVRASDAGNNASNWSVIRNFTVDTIAPAAPVLSSPANNARVTGIPTYRWLAAPGAKYYQLAYDKDGNFSTGSINTPKRTVLFYKPATQAKGLWYWRVRAQDAAGNWGPWSTARKVTLK